jgi:hypothetical protein
MPVRVGTTSRQVGPVRPGPAPCAPPLAAGPAPNEHLVGGRAGDVPQVRHAISGAARRQRRRDASRCLGRLPPSAAGVTPGRGRRRRSARRRRPACCTIRYTALRFRCPPRRERNTGPSAGPRPRPSSSRQTEAGSTTPRPAARAARSAARCLARCCASAGLEPSAPTRAASPASACTTRCDHTSRPMATLPSVTVSTSGSASANSISAQPRARRLTAPPRRRAGTPRASLVRARGPWSGPTCP